MDGYTELDLDNDVNTLAAQPEAAPGDDPNGAIKFHDIDDLTVGTVTVTVNAETWEVAGITTSDADVSIVEVTWSIKELIVLYRRIMLAETCSWMLAAM